MSPFPPGDPLPLPVVAHGLAMHWRAPAIQIYRRLSRGIIGTPERPASGGRPAVPAGAPTILSVVVGGEPMIPRAEAERLLALRPARRPRDAA